MIIRRAENKDISQLLEILKQVESVHQKGRPDLFKKDGVKYTSDDLIKLVSDDTHPIFVASEGEKILGYGFCVLEEYKSSSFMVDRKSIYIDDICVDENSRRMGVGSRIFEYIKNYAKSIGCYNITLNVWKCNRAAEKFYESLGMVPLKTCLETIIK